MDTATHYAGKLVPNYFKTLSLYMDFQGQKRAELIFQIIITFFGVVGFVWGYICQQFSQTFYIVMAGFILSCLLTLPPWPMYRRNPLKWKPVLAMDEGGDSEYNKLANKAANKKKKKIN